MKLILIQLIYVRKRIGWNQLRRKYVFSRASSPPSLLHHHYVFSPSVSCTFIIMVPVPVVVPVVVVRRHKLYELSYKRVGVACPGLFQRLAERILFVLLIYSRAYLPFVKRRHSNIYYLLCPASFSCSHVWDRVN